MRCVIFGIFSTVLLLHVAFSPSVAQEDTFLTSSDCVRIEGYMEADIRPADLIQGGGLLEPSVGVAATITSNDAGDRWVFGGQGGTIVTLTLVTELPLRVRLYQQMVMLADETLASGEQTLSLEVPNHALYSLTISRPDLLDTTTLGQYTVSVAGAATVIEENQAVTVQNADSRFIFYNRLLPAQTQADIQLSLDGLAENQLRLTTDTTEFFLTPVESGVQTTLAESAYYVLEVTNGTGSRFTLTTPNLNTSRLATIETLVTPRWDNYPNAPTLSIQAGVVEFAMLDGVRLRTAPNTFSSVSPIPLLFFADRQSSFRFGRNSADEISLLDGSLSIVHKNGFIYVEEFAWQGDFVDSTNFQTFELVSGETVRVNWDETENLWILPTCLGLELTNGRRVIAEATELTARPSQQQEFVLEAVSGDLAYDVTVDWVGLEEVVFEDALVKMRFNDQRRFETDRLGLTVRHEEQVQTILSGGAPFVSTDWENILGISVLDNTIRLEVADERGVIQRLDRQVNTLETAQEAIRIRWTDNSESLLLPESEDFIQIETPAEPTIYDPAALPGQRGFLPAGLNNTGLECYPVTTALEFNCADNGLANPANGNLVYAVTDLALPGYAQDLTLTRTYNSRNANVDSSFGFGWSTDFLLDFNEPRDENARARILTETTPYKLMLDLTQAPRGQVIFTTPSGSRHVFRAERIGDALTSATLPGWQIAARPDDLGAEWRVFRRDGLLYLFDRAGRLKGIDYPQNGGLTITRLAPFPNAQYRLQDALLDQYLMLVFDDRQHIVSAALHDADDSVLDEVFYEYEDETGRLIRVVYSDGTPPTTYTYDDAGNLIAHDDTRAPITPIAEYSYEAPHRVRQISLPAYFEDGSAWVYRAYDYSAFEDVLTTRITDEWGGRESRQYQLSFAPETAYRLTGKTTSLETIGYEYERDGFLIAQAVFPLYVQGFDYLADGTLREIQNDGEVIGFRAEYETRVINGHPVSVLMSYTDNPVLGLPQAQYEYNSATGQLTQYTDTNGLITTITARDEIFGLPAVLELNDGNTIRQITLTYDSHGRVIERSEGNIRTQFGWDAYGRLITYTDTAQRVYTIRYEADCRIVVDPLSVETRSCYDARQRLRSVEMVEADGTTLQATTYAYDGLDRLIEVTQSVDDATSQVTQYFYEMVDGQQGDWRLRTIDPYGRTQVVVYDEFDRVVRVGDFLSRESRYEYTSDRTSEKVTRTDATGLQTQLTYSIANQLCSAQVGDITYDFAYTENCTTPQRYPTRVAIGSLLLVNFEDYDAAGRAGRLTFSVNRPLDNEPGTLPPPSIDERLILEYAYDAYGQPSLTGIVPGTATEANLRQAENTEVTTVTDENGLRRVRVHQTSNGNTSTVTSTYDALGRLIQVESSEHGVSYRYEDLPAENRLQVTMNFSTGEQWRLRYDGAGNLTEWIDHNGKITTYVYDRLSRLLEVRANGLLVASYQYNELNQVLLIRNQYGQETRYVYNALGLLTTERDFNDVVTVYTYDPFGNISSVTDALGYRISYQYDNQNRLVNIIDASGREVSFDWSNAEIGEIRYVSDDHFINYYFDLAGRLWTIHEGQIEDDGRDEVLNQHYFRYDAAGHLVGFMPYAGADTVYDELAATLFAYGVQQQVVAIDGAENITRANDTLAQWDWQFVYDAEGRLIQRRHLDNTHEAYPPINFGYDALGRLITLNMPEVYNRNYQYAPASVTYENGATTTTLTYDEFFRRTSEIQVGAATPTPFKTTYFYENGTQNFSTQDPFGVQTVYIYPQATDVDQPYYLIVREMGLTTATPEFSASAEQTGGREYRYVLNARGELVEIQRDELFDDNGEVTRYRLEEQVNYDPSRRPIRYVDAQNNAYTFAYDTQGNLITFQTPDGASTFYGYDIENRLVEIQNPGNQIIRLGYDLRGNVQQVLLNNTRVEAYEYDANGKLTERQFNDQTITYQYDTTGALIGWGTEENPQVTIVRDAFGRTNRINSSVFTYDANGQVSSATNNTVSYAYTVDAAGRLMHLTEDDNRDWDFQYQEDGRSFTLVIGDDAAHQLNVTLDAKQRLQSVATSEYDIVVDYAVRQAENFIQVELIWGDGYETQVRFNRLGQIIRVVHNRNVIDFNTLIFNYDLNYLGLPQAIDEPEYDIFVGYDAAYRPATTRWLYTGLDPERTPDSIEYAFTLTYDRAGNRATELILRPNGAQSFYLYSEADGILRRSETQRAAEGWLLLLGISGWMVLKLRRPRLLLLALVPLVMLSGAPVQQDSPALEYIQNENGNVVRIQDDRSIADTRNFDYDAFGRLIRITNTSDTNKNSDFRYDAFGRLVAWQTPTQLLEFRYDGNTLVEIKRDGQVQMVAAFPGAPLMLVDNGTARWALYDGIEDLRLTFTGDYENVTTLQQDIFGRHLTDDSSSTETPASFQLPLALGIPIFRGMFYDEGNQIYIRLDGRAYDPLTGRYLQRDLLGLDGNGDLYTYKPERFDLPVLRRAPYPFFEGLETLIQATQRAGVLDAEMILNQYIPGDAMVWQDSGLAALQVFNQTTFQQLYDYVEIPQWVAHIYNPQGVQVDAQGNFALSTTAAQMIHPMEKGWSPVALDALVSAEIAAPTWYAPEAWRPALALENSLPQPMMGQRDPVLVTGAIGYPFADLNFYENLVTGLENLPVENAETWLGEIDAATLPQAPTQLPRTMEGWLAQWFTQDTIGVWEELRDIYSLPVPPSTDLPALNLID